MDHNQSRNNLTTLLAIDFAFVAVIVVLLFGFLRKSEASAKLQARDRIESFISAWGEQLEDGAQDAMALGTGIREFIELSGAGSDADALDSYFEGKDGGVFTKEVQAYLKSLVDNSDVSHVLICSKEEILFDENGNRPSAYKADLSAGITEKDLVFFYTESAPFETDGKHLVVRVPITENYCAYVFTDLLTVSYRFKGNLFDNCSFLAIVDSNGNKVCNFDRYNDRDCIYLSETNVLSMVEKGVIDGVNFSSLRNTLAHGEVACFEADLSGDKRTVAITNINVGKDKWALVYGVRQQNVDRLIESNIENAKDAILKLSIVMAVFSVFIIITVIVNNMKFREHGRELEDKADTDLLTDLYNKAATERKIQEYLDASPNGRGLMFILDIDNFKKVNDTMGHAFGDTLLKTLGKEIKAEFRVSDIIGRTGGDEFMVFLKDVNDDVIVEREANRITKFFHDFKAGGDYVKYSATASIGAAIFPDDAKNFKDLYVAADQALYRAKKRGKNQLVFFNEDNKQ